MVRTARPEADTMVIDCDACAARGPACTDCVVTFLLGPDTRSHELPGEEVAALAVLADSGLVPPLRLVPRDEAPGWRDAAGA